jgi:hypothetical protein
MKSSILLGCIKKLSKKIFEVRLSWLAGTPPKESVRASPRQLLFMTAGNGKGYPLAAVGSCCRGLSDSYRNRQPRIEEFNPWLFH